MKVTPILTQAIAWVCDYIHIKLSDVINHPRSNVKASFVKNANMDG